MFISAFAYLCWCSPHEEYHSYERIYPPECYWQEIASTKSSVLAVMWNISVTAEWSINDFSSVVNIKNKLKRKALPWSNHDAAAFVNIWRRDILKQSEQLVVSRVGRNDLINSVCYRGRRLRFGTVRCVWCCSRCARWRANGHETELEGKSWG